MEVFVGPNYSQCFTLYLVLPLLCTSQGSTLCLSPDAGLICASIAPKPMTCINRQLCIKLWIEVCCNWCIRQGLFELGQGMVILASPQPGLSFVSKFSQRLSDSSIVLGDPGAVVSHAW